jgi:hypothetical protein
LQKKDCFFKTESRERQSTIHQETQMSTIKTRATIEKRATSKSNGGANNLEIEEEIIEEDWSQLMAQEEGGAFSNERFSYYDKITFPLSTTAHTNGTSTKTIPPLTMELCCMGSLTPLDMLDLSNGECDATGNRIWMGALLFIECMVRPLPPMNACRKSESSNSENEKDLLNCSKIQALGKLRTMLFRNKQLIELGAGTGASLISVGIAGTKDSSIRPSRLTLTDNDTNVLSLCKMNCVANLKKDIKYKVCRLEWGLQQMLFLAQKHCESTCTDESDYFCMNDASYQTESQDTVIATDVIYDLSALKVLFETASHLVKNGGHFVLSHVPRASIDCESNTIREALERRILEEASKHAFLPLSKQANTIDNGASSLNILGLLGDDDYAIRPSDLTGIWGEGKKIMASAECDYEEMDSVGASIMIFVKVS